MVFGLVRLGNVESNICGKRGFAHGRATRDNDQIGRLQATHLFIQITQAGGDTGQAAVALIGCRCHVDGNTHGVREALEPAFILTTLSQAVERLLRVHDLRRGRVVDRSIKGTVVDFLTDTNEIGTNRKVVNCTTILRNVDNGRGRSRQASKVLAATNLPQPLICIKIAFERHRCRNMSARHQFGDGRKNTRVKRLVEMLRFQERRNSIKRIIIDEESTKQCLFRLDIVRRNTVIITGILLGVI